MTYWRISENPFSLPRSLLSILREKYFFPVHAVGRSSVVNQAHFSVRGTLLRWNNTRRICESERWKNNDATRHYETAKRTKCPSGRCMRVSAMACRWFSRWNASNRTRRIEKALIRGSVWFFNTRATGRACVCMQSTGRIFRSCSAATAAWRHRREICIYQAGATNISFIICSERLICSPRRAASTCPPPVDPRRRPPSGSLSRCPLSISVRVEPRHAPFYPSLPRRLKLIPNNACKSLGKCTSRVKTAPPSAGNGGHSIFVQRCFRRCAMERSRSCESSRCPCPR